MTYNKSLGSLFYSILELNPLSANTTKWSNTLKQFIGNSPGVGAERLYEFDYKLLVYINIYRHNHFHLKKSKVG